MRLRPKKSRTTRYERASMHQVKREKALAGEGIYVFRNKTKGEMHLIKPSLDGKKMIRPGETFRGDSYFSSMVPRDLSLVETIITPEQQRMESKMAEEKLIVDQPDRITTEGKVEQILVDPKKQKPLNEEKKDKCENHAQEDILLVDDAVDGVEIII